MLDLGNDHHNDRGEDDDDEEDDENLLMVVKPDWIDHDNCAINAVHVHPDGKRFATAGGDSRVRIWSCEPLLCEEPQQAEHPDKLLSVLTVHTGGVNCVRWSPSGHLLASAGDDRVPLLWTCTQINDTKQNDTVNVFSGSGSHAETYKCLANLVGHDADVQDLAWSPDCRRLASCSIDNSIIIWDTETFTKIACLTSHTNWVKGLSWDPMDNYLISQAEDGTLIIWRTDDWIAEHTVRKPFLDLQFAHNYASDVNRQIVFRRPSWSPDGMALVGTYAHHKVFTSPVLNRGSWKKNVAFVGHTRPTTVASFSPVMYSRGADKFYVCAVGSMDASVSIWATHSKTPIAIFRHFFTQAVLDIAWTPDGRGLFITSHDGTLAAVRFGSNDFEGTAVHPKDLELTLRKSNAKFAEPVLENPAAMLYRHQSLTVPDIAEKRSSRLDRLMSGSSAPSASFQRRIPFQSPQGTSPNVANLQRESRTADGKRRIVPVLAPENVDPDAMDISSYPAPASDHTGQVQVPASSPSVPNAAPAAVLLPVQTANTLHPMLAAPEVKKRFAVTVDDTASVAAQSFLGLQDMSALSLSTVVEVVNMSNGKSVLHCSKGSTSLWRSSINGSVTALAGNAYCCVALTEQGDMLWLSKHGMRLHPPIIVGSTPFHLSLSQSSFVLTICIDGALAVWDVSKSVRTVSANINPLISKDIHFISASLDAECNPIVSVSNHSVYTFIVKLGSWIRIRDQSFAQSEFYSTISNQDVPWVSAPLARLSTEERCMATLSHAEHEMATANVLANPMLYRKWALLLCRQLVMYANDVHPLFYHRLEELCGKLLGPNKVDRDESNQVLLWESHAAGGKLCKRSLAKEMLPIIATNSSLSKLTAHLHEQLNGD